MSNHVRAADRRRIELPKDWDKRIGTTDKHPDELEMRAECKTMM
jgi:hypothetical protein